jgi:hypothetical protein
VTDLPKYMERALASAKWPMLLILWEKHDTRYLLIDRREVLFREALAILKERKKGEYSAPGPFYVDTKLESFDPATVPESLRNHARSTKDSYESNKKANANEVKQWSMIHKAIADGDGALAWLILVTRSDHEYERIELRPFDNMKR